ncbi:MAG: hypothetical protein MRY32_00190 [Rickettsiales bacterium]|nr:hypothetical protein [Rickettsiales bacterium]
MIRFCLGMALCMLSSSAFALSCAPVNPKEIFQPENTAIIIGKVLTVAEGDNEKAGRGKTIQQRYGVQVVRSFKGPESNETIAVTGQAIGPWGAQILEPIDSGYLMVLTKEPSGDGYYFTQCSHVEPYRPDHAWIVLMMDAAQTYEKARLAEEQKLTLPEGAESSETTNTKQ